MRKKRKSYVTKAQEKADAVAKEFVSQSSLEADPLGSYTGNPKNKFEKPVQDADDI